MYITKVQKFKEYANPTVLNVLVDDSRSMMPLRQKGVVTGALNQIMIPALEGVNAAQKKLLRISLGAFSDGKILSLTKIPGYYSVNELRSNPISNHQFGRSGLDGNTALYASMIGGIKSARDAAIAIVKQSGHSKVLAQLVVITDGANYTNNPTTTADVARVITNIGPETDYCVDLRVNLAYFGTGGGVTRAQFERIAKDCKVTKCHFWDDHPRSYEEQEKAFRRLVELLSDPRNLQ